MHWTDEAIILSARKFGEDSGIVTMLTRENGLCKGLVRSIAGKRNRGIYQIGNIVEANWRGRLAEQLGSFSAELSYCGAASVMGEPLKLAALSSICSSLEATLPEKDSVPVIYNNCKNFINLLGMDGSHWQAEYIFLEMELLTQLGFGLDLSACAATGEVEDLMYVSPKSGRAVSRSAGLPYCNKLLKLPKFLLEGTAANYNHDEISDGIILCSYFLDKYFFTPHNIREPEARTRFVGMIKTKHGINSGHVP